MGTAAFIVETPKTVSLINVVETLNGGVCKRCGNSKNRDVVCLNARDHFPDVIFLDAYKRHGKYFGGVYMASRAFIDALGSGTCCCLIHCYH